METNTFADFGRLFLTIGWGVSAFLMWKTARHAPASVKVIRYFAVGVFTAYALFYFVYNWATHSGWDLSWHNETARLLNYFMLSLTIVWGLRPREKWDCR